MFITEPIGDDDPGSGFSCGEPALDTFFARHALPNDRRGLGRTFVLRRPADRLESLPAVLGFYTISMADLEAARVPEGLRAGLPRYPVPVALIGRLAVDARTQGLRVGERLLADALARVVLASQQIACIGVIVDAKTSAPSASTSSTASPCSNRSPPSPSECSCPWRPSSNPSTTVPRLARRGGYFPCRQLRTNWAMSVLRIRIESVEILTYANRPDPQSAYTVAVETLSRRAASLTVSSKSAPKVTFPCITGALNDRRKSTKPGEGTESASSETSPDCEDLPDPASLDSWCGRDWGASGRWFKSSRPDSVAPVIPQESRGFLFILSPAIFTTAGIALRVPPPQVTSQVTFRGPRSARRRAAPRGQGDVRPSFLTPHLGPSRPPMARTVGEGRASLVTPPRTAMPSAG